MIMIKRWKSTSGLVMVLCLAALGGCTTVQTAPPSSGGDQVKVPSAEKQGWWYARFKINWPQGSSPQWHVDLLIAREVVEPVLNSFQDEISLWRFHRRARRDGASHRFSFIIYATPEAAERIFLQIQRSPELEKLRAQKLVVKDWYDDTAKMGRPDIEDTSDPDWSSPLQRAWPYFIMGVSATWLDLVDRLAAQAKEEGVAKGKSEEAFYREVNKRLVKLWRDEGGHAFLHHLSAIFGYQATFVYQRQLVTF